MKTSSPRSIRLGAAIGLLAGLLTFGSGLLAQTSGVALNPAHPDRYVVKKGDTLWGISAMFLKDPWYWPEIWYVNPQIENPHLIYPGDVISLAYVNGKPQLQLERGQAATGGGTESLSPRVREEALSDAIKTIPYEVIAPFLSRGVVLEKKEIEKLPTVLAFREGHLAAATDNDAYVTGKLSGVGAVYSVVHIGDALKDPDDGDVVGYEGIYVGDGLVRRTGKPSTIVLNSSTRETVEGDRLVTQNDPLPLSFTPRAPTVDVNGRIIHVVDGMTEIGQYAVVVLNRGSRDGLAPGDVLAVWQTGDRVPGKVDANLFTGKVKLPDELAGNVMVFKTYDRISYALVMRAEGPMHVLDKVKNPG